MESKVVKEIIADILKMPDTFHLKFIDGELKYIERLTDILE